MNGRSSYLAPFQVATRSLIENEVEERKSSDEDSIGETDRDFGEYHIGKSLVKITPHQRVNAIYQQGYRIVADGVIIEDEVWIFLKTLLQWHDNSRLGLQDKESQAKIEYNRKLEYRRCHF